MPAPFTTPVALSVPFIPNRTSAASGNIPSGIMSINVQDAIEEGLVTALNNDRYPFIASYNGAAGNGKYLEVYPGNDSASAPFQVPDESIIKTISYLATANSTGVFGFYDIKTSPSVLLFQLSVSGSKDVTWLDMNYVITPDTHIAIKVDSGSFNKPALTIWVNTSIGFSVL